MTVNVALHHAAHARIAQRLAALKLPLRLLLLQEDGRYTADGAPVRLADAPPEAAWLSLDHGRTGQFNQAIDDLLAPGATRWLQTFNAGLDDPRYREIARAGIRISASSAQAVAISEYTFAHVLNLYQPIEAQRQLQAKREWKRLPFRELSRSTWLLVGFGNIGQELAKRAKAFGARVLAVRRRPAASALADEVAGIDALPRFLAQADIVVLAAPHTRESERMAGTGFFAALKPGAILVNIARGGLVDDKALLAALDAGRVSTAILDVFEPEPLPAASPYWSHPRVRLTAHSSFAGEGTMHRGDELFLANLPRYIAGRPLLNEVDTGYLKDG
jgi:phosphoglycerate dehydrogenase-like enzyme